MPYPYPTDLGNSSQNLYTLTRWVNDGIGGIMMPIMLVVIWIIIFIGTLSEGRQASRGFVFASFICSVLAIILCLVGMLANQYMYFSFLMVAGGIIWYNLENSPGI